MVQKLERKLCRYHVPGCGFVQIHQKKGLGRNFLDGFCPDQLVYAPFLFSFSRFLKPSLVRSRILTRPTSHFTSDTEVTPSTATQPRTKGCVDRGGCDSPTTRRGLFGGKSPTGAVLALDFRRNHMIECDGFCVIFSNFALFLLDYWIHKR